MNHHAPVLAALALASSASAWTLYSDTLRQGPRPEWIPAVGQWAWTSDGLKNAIQTENRIFLWGATQGHNNYRITLDASLNSGPGWTLFFRASVTGAATVNGWAFQYDPSFGGGAYRLLQWINDGQSQIATTFAPLSHNVFHPFDIAINDNSFEAKRNGQTVLSYSGPMPSAGSLVGLRTWYESDATFKNFTMSTIPAPAALPLFAAVASLASRRRRPAL